MVTKQENGVERHDPVHVAPGPDPGVEGDDDALSVQAPTPGPCHTAAAAHTQGVHGAVKLRGGQLYRQFREGQMYRQ